ncbi:MAG: histidine kinase [Acidobacteria bacterium]|nr:MAG: histidine kinase [Acidobacteriota bacterium]
MSQPQHMRRGRLKVFLSYAAGAGKTYRMLEEAQALKRKGIDVVVGYFEPHGRKDTIEKIEGLEIIPRRKIEYRGVLFEEMDTDAILQRAPKVCAVDEFPHTNVPGSQRAKRWEEVMVLLEAGIDVLTTMNLQHLESLNDQVFQISGIRVRETVPDWVIKQADEVVMVDVTPEALINRLRRGVVYEPEKATKALENFFKEQTLVALRELALRQAAHEVEHRQEEQRPTDRILIHVTGEPTTAMLIRRGRRVADYIRAECFATYVSSTGDLSNLPPAEREAVERHLNFARNLHIETRTLRGQDRAATLVEFARRHHITQIFLARSRSRGWKLLRTRNLVSQVIGLAQDIQVTVVAERRRPKS